MSLHTPTGPHAIGPRRPQLPPGVAPLIFSRGVRSFVQGFVNIVFPLYLLRIGVSTVLVGTLFTASALASSMLTLGVGLLADRWGRKPFVLAFAGLTALSGLVFLLSRNFWVLGAVAVLAGVGRGGIGGGAQGGAFAPAEQALLAEKSGEGRRTGVFALNAAAGSYAAAAGALLSGVASWLALPRLPLLGYQVLFGLTLAGGLVMMAALLRVSEGRREDQPRRGSGRRRSLLPVRSRRVIAQLSLAGAVNGLGWGFLGGFFPIWFHLRFGVGAGLIGGLVAAGGLIMGPGFALATRLAGRWGEVRAITASRAAAVVLLACLPLAPGFGFAAAVYLAWVLLARMVMPLRQSFAMGAVDERERAASVGIRGTATRLPSAAGPLATGYFLSVDAFALPFWCAALCQAAAVVLYYLFFRDLGGETSTETSAET